MFSSMRQFVTGVLLAGALIGGPVWGQDGARVVLKPHVTKDPGSGNMDSHVVLVPAGWTVEGGAWWPPAQLFKILPSQDIKVTGPDGTQVHIGASIAAVDFRPSAYTVQQLGISRPQEGSVDSGSLVLYMPDNLPEWQGWLQNKILPQSYPKARNIRVTNLAIIPELTAILRRQIEPLKQMTFQNAQQMQAMGQPTTPFADGAFLAAHVTLEEGGQQWEQLHIFGSVFFGSDNQLGRQIFWAIEPNVTYRAPAGKLESSMPLMMAIANSVQPTPQWTKMKSDHIAKMNQIAAKGAADRSRIIADSNREISRIITEGYESRMASQDESHRKFINAIRDVEEYKDPSRDYPVHLPNNYDHVYSNGNGEYILSNDVNYDPNRDQNINNLNWDRLEVYKPQQ